MITKKIFKLMLLLTILFIPLSVFSDTISVLEKEALYSSINKHVIKENNLFNYIRQYMINTFDNTPTRNEINKEFDLNNTVWNNYMNNSCSLNSSGECLETGGITFTIFDKSTTLIDSLTTDTSTLSQDIKDIYNNNSYELINSYTLNDKDRYYQNDDILRYVILLRNHIYSYKYDSYISKTELPITKGLWFKPNNVNGLDTYIYNITDSKWKFIGTIGYNENTPYELNFDEGTIFNPDTFPGVVNMTANVSKGNNLLSYYFNGTKWINKSLKSSGVSFFNGYSNILPLTTDLLLKIGDSKAIVQDNIFFSLQPTARKLDVEEYDSNGTKLDLKGFWKTEDNLNLFTDSFSNNIFYRNKYVNNVKWIFFPNSAQTDYIPMYLLDNINKFVYVSRTNGYDGILEYPYNVLNNVDSTNIGNDLTNTLQYSLSWDTKDSNSTRLESKKQLFEYNNDKVFYSVKDMNNSVDRTLQITTYRTYFNVLNNTYKSYYSKYSNCDITGNLGDNKCHGINGVFSGDYEDNLFKWYFYNGLLYDAHFVNNYNDMYVKDPKTNEYYPLIIYNNELYDLVLDSNNNACYKKRIDGKYYSYNGKLIPYYVNGIGVLPEDKTCSNVIINENGKIVFNDLYDLVNNYDKAPDGSLAYVISKGKDYEIEILNDIKYWFNSIDLIKVTKEGRDILPNTYTNDYKYLTLQLGKVGDENDLMLNYRYTQNGISYGGGNTIENNYFKQWFGATTTKSINNMIDADCKNTKYTSSACDIYNGYSFNSTTNLCEKKIYKNKENYYGVVSYSFIDNKNGSAPPGGGYSISFNVYYPIKIKWLAYSEDTELNVNVDNTNVAYWGGKSYEGHCNSNLVISHGGCTNQDSVDYFGQENIVNNNFYLGVYEGGSASTPAIGYNIQIILLSSNYLQNQQYPISIPGAVANYGYIPICTDLDYNDNGNNCIKILTESPNCTNKKMLISPYIDTFSYIKNNGNCYSELGKVCEDLGFIQEENYKIINDGESCDDNNLETINDKYINGICIGTNIEGQNCNDNNVQTINDVYHKGVCAGTNMEGNLCNDNNVYTINDIYHNGICSGNMVEGQVCDDENLETINDKYINGICIGTNVEGQSCNDDNIQTVQDIYHNGVCSGVNVEGQSCNDGDSTTTNDTYHNGICSGVNVEGQACNDGDSTTSNDTYHNGVCSGIKTTTYDATSVSIVSNCIVSCSFFDGNSMPKYTDYIVPIDNIKCFSNGDIQNVCISTPLLSPGSSPYLNTMGFPGGSGLGMRVYNKTIPTISYTCPLGGSLNGNMCTK